MIIAYVGFGGNVGEPSEIASLLRRAADSIASWREVKAVELSAFLASAPVGPIPDQAEFINAVARVEVRDAVEPAGFLRKLLALEEELGRTREGPDQGPRTVDLDLLLFGDQIVADEPACIVPHPRLLVRAFALVPLRELAGGAYEIPGSGLCVDEALANPAVTAQDVRAVILSA